MLYSYILYSVPLIISIILSSIILNRLRLFCSGGIFFNDPHNIDNNKSNGLVEIGGISIFPILLISLCLSLGISRWFLYFGFDQFQWGISGDRILQVIAGCSLLYIVGLKNDLHGTWPRTKLLILLAATSMFPLSGLWIRDFQGVFGIHEVSPWIGIPFTIILSMYITEAVVLLDDIDGLGIGLMSVMLIIFLGFSITYGFTLGILITTATLGVSIIYSMMKITNKSWKKTLVGNAGSYPLGYILSYATLSLIHPANIEMPNGMLMIVLGVTMVPMIDLLRTLRLRVQEGRAIATPDRNLIQHRFIRMGISPAWAAVCVIALIIVFAAINTIWTLYGLDLSALAVIDLTLWFIMHVSFTYLIRHHEDQKNQKDWTITYGRDAWEADVPVECIRRKHDQYGTMGLSPKYIMGEETDFIPDGMTGFERSLKRIIDFCIATVLLIVFSPVFLLCFILIKLDDHGDIIYRQERIGRFGRPFFIYKFRSMRPDAEQNGPALSHSGGDDDSRLTAVGRFLRSHHLDELPQLWNVFRGDMSFIGYRPERKFFIDQIMTHDPRYTMLFQIRPGITSYATLYNGYTDTMEKMLRRLNYDLYYLEHRSFWLDCKILWLTFISIVCGKKF